MPSPGGRYLPGACARRRAGAGGRAERAGRGTLLYNALTMAAMAYMLAAMDVHGADGPLAGPDAAGMPGQTPHHGGPAVGLSLPGALAGAEQGWGSQSAVVLALAFGVAGAVWGLLLFRRLRTRRPSAQRRRVPGTRGLGVDGRHVRGARGRLTCGSDVGRCGRRRA